MTVRQLRNNIDSHEYMRWKAFDRVYPIGEERADLRAGIIASTTANCHRGRNQEAFKHSDFMYEYKGEQTPRDVEQAIDAAFEGM